ncbi:MAG: ammonium transporter [Pseudomonadales bacterium]|nr:ammonium transporter [Pseudomonadales bacterium]
MKRLSTLVLGCLVLAAGPVHAATAALDTGNTAWMLTSTALVLFMTLPGLALFYGGLVRTRNVLSILMQCFAITAVVSLMWLIGLYSLAFTSGGAWNALLGGGGRILFSGMGRATMGPNGVPEVLFAMYQMTFAIITPALIIGGYAERVRFSSMLVFSVLWTALVYTPVCHWVWGGGFLQQKGLLDYAGGTVVHITAGVASLVAALTLGARKGFPRQSMAPHNMTMTVTGAGMLWVGWFGFNAGSALAADGAASMALAVTHISAATGALTWMFLEWWRFGKPSVLGIVTGMVAGLGTITPAAGSVGPGGALLVGLSAGVVCFLMTQLIKRVWAIDDSLDVFPVHGVGGVLGTLMAGLLCSPSLGVFSGMGMASQNHSIVEQLSVQLQGVGVTLAYTAVITWVVIKATSWLTGPMRVQGDQETEGLDLVLHEERGYDL